MNNQNVHVTVQLVTWNGAKYIPYLFDSLRKQTYTNWSLMVLDNNSDDDTVESIKKEFPDCTFPKEMIELDSNIGFANGHNLLFRRNKSEFVLLLNQDMYLRSDVITNLVESMLTNEKCASVSPRLMRWDFQKVSDLESLDASFTDTVDSMGLKVFRNRRVIEQYRWQNWSDIQAGFHDKRFLEVFGVSGTLPMYRRIFLETLAYHDNLIFDPLYHSYKEDVDLAFRIISAGYSSSVLLQTVAYHDRSGVGAEKLDDISASKNKLQQSILYRKVQMVT